MPNDSVQLDIFPTCLHLERVDPDRNMRRFYRMTIENDIFGGTRLIRIWARIGTRGCQQVNVHADEGRAISALMEFAQKKIRRGYEL